MRSERKQSVIDFLRKTKSIGYINVCVRAIYYKERPHEIKGTNKQLA